ncbi:AraC family transcriptional regulator [Paenibacillus sp. CF384]|uniref:helix-turn-helix transcriptional regulator n=1 Tax=Paenibacillus sp. CF384 TaxID=1884382 RepID=UPI000898F2AA|nr:AraC family transcriptional regulator [Paenibacillus sp. CF384]SDW46841.1 AraC-type DNA-binding protein [Paenibacillus sp. CF384]
MDHMFRLPNLYNAIRIPGIEYAKQEAGWSYPDHRHPFFEFLFCISGEIEQWVNGRMYHLHPGDAIIIQSDMLHRTETRVGCSFFDFHFEVEINAINMIFQLTSDPVFRSESHGNVSEWVTQFITRFGEHLQQMMVAREDKRASITDEMAASVKQLQIHSSILDFIGNLASELISTQNHQLPTSGIKPSQMKLAREAAYWMEYHLHTPMNISSLSIQLNVHRTYLHECFKLVYGLSPSVYLQRIRIREAKKLLQNQSISVEEIAHSLCYSSTSHFSHAFRTAMGVSPQQFRHFTSTTRE